MLEADVLDQVKARTGAEDAQVTKKVTESVWSVLLSFPDGPDAYKFETRLVDVEGPEIRLIGFNW
jgi:hypothetical protein